MSNWFFKQTEPCESWLPELRIRVELAWANSQCLVSHYFFPVRLHPSLSDPSQPGALLPMRLHSEKRLQLGTPATGDLDARWLFKSSHGQRLRLPFFRCTRVYSPSQGKPDSTGLRGGSKLRIPGPTVSSPLQSSHGTQACSGSRYGKQHMSGRSEGIK